MSCQHSMYTFDQFWSVIWSAIYQSFFTFFLWNLKPNQWLGQVAVHRRVFWRSRMVIWPSLRLRSGFPCSCRILSTRLAASCRALRIFPECVAKGSRFTFGGLGVDPCSRDPASGVRKRPQPFATVRNRPQASATVRLRPSWPQSCRANVTFLTCQKMWSCRFAWQAWHFVTFQHVSQDAPKVVLCGRHNTFATFSEDVLHFSRQAQHFGHLPCHFAWQAQHFRRVVLRVFCEAHRQRCAKWWQGANSVAGVAFYVMKIDGSLARNVDFAAGP